MFSFKKALSFGLSAVLLSAPLAPMVHAETGLTSVEFPTLSQYNWVQNGGATSAAIAIQGYGEAMYQAIRGNSSPYKIYVRSTSDGIFDNSAEREAWDALGVAGNTSTQPALAVFSGKLYIAVRGNSGTIFTKSMSSEGIWDETWNNNGGATSAAIGMAYVDFGEDARLYQAIKGNTTNNIYLRYTSDGTFDGGTGENWVLVSGQTPNEISLAGYGNKLIMSIRGNSGEIWNRATTDGTFDGGEGEDFVQNGGKTSLAPTLISAGEAIYQVVKGNSTDSIFTRASFDGMEWTDWVNRGGSTQTRPGMGYALGTVYQAVRGNSGQIFSREFAQLVHFESANEPWSFDYFNFLGSPTSTFLQADQCANGDGYEALSWDTFRTIAVGGNCFGGGGGGDMTIMKSGTMNARDGKTLNFDIIKNNTNNTYIIDARSIEGNGLRVFMQTIPTYAEALLWETDVRAIVSTMEHTPTPMVP